ncbi:MAG: orotate phosphoribosyltransferase [Clostridiales Family XIII bacterium]|nr:orotate phosphoribosyltransferase [Clostridiales Family XIII bacterium]
MRFLIDRGALIFGDFTLKSGRKSPYMLNTGAFDTGASLMTAGEYYAKAIEDAVNCGVLAVRPDIFFGSAYKGIPLAVAAAIAASKDGLRDVACLYNRKEEKDHGEGGTLVGRIPKGGDKILVLDDVITAGTALGAAVELLEAQTQSARIIGSAVAVDRMERSGPSGESALRAASKRYGFPVFSIISALDIVDVLEKSEGEIFMRYASAMRSHLKKFGALEV